MQSPASLDVDAPLSRRFSFVELRESIVEPGMWLRKRLRVRHNPLTDERILRHACRFLLEGELATETEGVRLSPIETGNFRESDASYYGLHVRANGEDSLLP